MGKEQQALNPAAINGAETEAELDLVEVFYLLWGHILQIIACFLAGALLAFGFTYFFVTPMYQASASIYIVSASNNSIVNLTDLQIGSQLTADYQELMLSRPLLQDVIKNLDLDTNYRSLAGQVSITNANDTRILKVTVTDSDPERAADIANELIKQARIYLPEIMETETPNVVEDAVVPTQKSSPSYAKNTVLGALLGAVLCCGVLLVQYLMKDSFDTPDDVAKYLGVQPLATIPEVDLGSFNHNDTKKKREIIVTDPETGDSKTYLIPYGSRIKIMDGAVLEAGDELTEGSVNPHDILRIKGVRAVQDYMLREVQRVYRLQGVEINDKHIEVIVRQMLQKVRVETNGDSEMLPGVLVDALDFEDTNEKLVEEGKEPAEGKQVLLGITKASLATNSFLSAASFQETTKVLTEAAIKGKVDPLIGMKENVIIGKLIPAGTGMKRYRNIKLDSDINEDDELMFDDFDDFDDYEEEIPRDEENEIEEAPVEEE